jgi:hypothetical protein
MDCHYTPITAKLPPFPVVLFSGAFPGAKWRVLHCASMARIGVMIMSGDSFQVRFHPKLGVVIYDPVAQMGLAGEQIRLFKVGAMGASTFMKAIVNKDLAPCPVDTADDNSNAVSAYRTARANRRKPYCEQCRRHFGSVDFTVCTDCSSIRCTCGTCSCVTKRRKAA